MPTFGEHPVIAPALVAAALAALAVVALSQDQWATGILAWLDAVGMAAIAAHSRVERGEE
jgi:ABC-type uncharacterized transport system permease subunit